jgi:predicted DNA-binding WGR domain protein
LNVIFSRARHNMAIVSSIRHHDITNDYNDGANSLKNFLQYAEAVSQGDAATARRVLENLNPLSRKALAPASKDDVVVERLAAALRVRGYSVDLNVGQSRFRCDLAVRGNADALYQLGILVDTTAHYANPNLLDRYLMQPGILRAFGWRFTLVLTKDWYHDQDDVLNRIGKLLLGGEAAEETVPADDDEPLETAAPAMADPVKPSTPPVPPAPAAPPKPPAESPTVGTPAAPSRRFEFTSGSSRKFWEISVSGNTFTVRFGRIGTTGQVQSKTFSDEAKAAREAWSLISEKLKKGYLETTG